MPQDIWTKLLATRALKRGWFRPVPDIDKPDRPGEAFPETASADSGG